MLGAVRSPDTVAVESMRVGTLMWNRRSLAEVLSAKTKPGGSWTGLYSRLFSAVSPKVMNSRMEATT